MIRVIYRLSDGGYAKEKPPYITNKNCLSNFIMTQAYYSDVPFGLHVICDNVSDETFDMVQNIAGWAGTIERTNLGSGAQSFNRALDIALGYGMSDIVYFVEDDYVHKPMWAKLLADALLYVEADYVSLYDHPDKYMNPSNGGNPFVEDGGEVTRVVCGNFSHYKLTNSTTMSFASLVPTLREDETILREFTSGTYPRDFDMFLKLREKGRSLVTPIPGHATHGETAWLSPFTDWERVMQMENVASAERLDHGVIG